MCDSHDEDHGGFDAIDHMKRKPSKEDPARAREILWPAFRGVDDERERMVELCGKRGPGAPAARRVPRRGILRFQQGIGVQFKRASHWRPP